jgi:hypothetical protein
MEPTAVGIPVALREGLGNGEASFEVVAEGLIEVADVTAADTRGGGLESQ